MARTTPSMESSRGIRAVSFVGSVKHAKYIYRRAAENGKRVQAWAARDYMIVMRTL